VYELDPANTFAHFELMHFGTSTIRGRIGPVNGLVQIDRAARRGELSLRIPTAGVSTGIPFFDARIRAADLLAAEAFPEAYFVATNFRFDGDSVAEVRGEFTLRGTSQPLSLRALRFSCRSDAVEGAAAVEVCGGDFEGHFLRSDFGLSFALPFVANRVRLLVQVEGRRR
jgi:polyisoprenoid-binding protein YceI